ncbi:MFS transporter [Halobacillus salinarum]|uniref:MFS transporter n=1 Tax=Halobacillus salinarum TaxID=2932257 RepID=A0ABY4EI76_9BACI|nr:MFS transporter [Halobacillus salinarum]UOQ43767.1 MFS transporter [Halobacillus salinarum]
MNKQVFIIAALIFLLSTGGYIAMPMFPVLTDVHSITLFQASCLTGVYIFTQKITPIAFGAAGDLFGYKKISSIGELIRGIGFLSLGVTGNFIALSISAGIAGIGGGLAGPSLQALLMSSGTPSERPKLSSLRSSATKTGLLVGPLLASVVIWTGSINVIFITAGVLYLLGSIGLITLIKGTSPQSPIHKGKAFLDFKQAFQNKRFMRLIIFMVLYYILFAQLFVSLPDYTKQFTNHIQILFLINGITGVILQYPVGIWLSKTKNRQIFVLIGVVSFIFCFSIIGLFHTFTALILGVFVLTIGQMIIVPIIDTSISNYADNSGNMGIYFGISKISDGLGRPIGSMLGGILLQNTPSMVTWYVFSAVGVVMFIYHVIFLQKAI